MSIVGSMGDDEGAKLGALFSAPSSAPFFVPNLALVEGEVLIFYLLRKFLCISFLLWRFFITFVGKFI